MHCSLFDVSHMLQSKVSRVALLLGIFKRSNQIILSDHSFKSVQLTQLQP